MRRAIRFVLLGLGVVVLGGMTSTPPAFELSCFDCYEGNPYCENSKHKDFFNFTNPWKTTMHSSCTVGACADYHDIYGGGDTEDELAHLHRGMELVPVRVIDRVDRYVKEGKLSALATMVARDNNLRLNEARRSVQVFSPTSGLVVYHLPLSDGHFSTLNRLLSSN